MTYLAEVDGRIIVIEGVPARVSLLTGERLYAPETVERIQAIVRGELPPTHRLDSGVRVLTSDRLRERTTMRKSIPIRASWPLRALVTVVVAAVLCVDLAAMEPPPPPRPWRPLPAVPPRGPFFGGQAVPNPIPVPMPMPIPVPNPNPFPFPLQPQYQFQLPNGLPPGSLGLGAAGSTDRCLVIASGNDPGSIKTADTAIDSGIFARPKVHGLPIQPPRWVPGRLRR